MIDAAAALMDDDQDYLLGEQFSGVDILMSTCLHWAVRYNLPLPEVFDAYMQRVAARPAFTRAVRENTP